MKCVSFFLVSLLIIIHIYLWNGRGEDRGIPLRPDVFLWEPFPDSKACLDHIASWSCLPRKSVAGLPGLPRYRGSYAGDVKDPFSGVSGVTAGEAVGRKNPLGLVEDSSSG